MSLITSCPACSTMFRVVPDQLKVSDGWVRCGQCSEVFDASLHFVQAADAAGLDSDATNPEPAGVAREGAGFPAGDLAAPAPHEQAGPRSEPQSEPQIGMSSEAADGALTTEVGSALQLSDHAAPEPMPDAASVARAATLDPADAVPDVSFVRQARRRAFWASPAARAGMSLVTVLLVVLLVGQVTYHERDRIAAVEPRAAPWLERACEWVGCEIQPLRQIEWITIDSSGFTKLRADTYRLQLVLKNVSPFDLAMPAVELTLTDTHDNPVVRRVITLAELGARDDLLRAGAEINASAALGVSAAGVRVAGYRVLAFYP